MSTIPILHLDEDPLVTWVVSQHLQEAGIDVVSVNDPREFTSRLSQERFRIVLFDLQMKSDDGMGLLKSIKQRDAGVQVILLSTLSSGHDLLVAKSNGAEACVPKPLNDPQQLIDAVKIALERENQWSCLLAELTSPRETAYTIN